MRNGSNIPFIKAKEMLVVTSFLKYGATINTTVVDVVVFPVF